MLVFGNIFNCKLFSINIQCILKSNSNSVCILRGMWKMWACLNANSKMQAACTTEGPLNRRLTSAYMPVLAELKRVGIVKCSSVKMRALRKSKGTIQAHIDLKNMKCFHWKMNWKFNKRIKSCCLTIHDVNRKDFFFITERFQWRLGSSFYFCICLFSKKHYFC